MAGPNGAAAQTAPAQRRGREFGDWIDQLASDSAYGEVRLTLKAGQITLIEYKQTYKDIKDALQRKGMDPEHVRTHT